MGCIDRWPAAGTDIIAIAKAGVVIAADPIGEAGQERDPVVFLEPRIGEIRPDAGRPVPEHVRMPIAAAAGLAFAALVSAGLASVVAAALAAVGFGAGLFIVVTQRLAGTRLSRALMVA